MNKYNRRGVGHPSCGLPLVEGHLPSFPATWWDSFKNSTIISLVEDLNFPPLYPLPSLEYEEEQ